MGGLQSPRQPYDSITVVDKDPSATERFRECLGTAVEECIAYRSIPKWVRPTLGVLVEAAHDLSLARRCTVPRRP